VRSRTSVSLVNASLPSHHAPSRGFRNPWPGSQPHGLRGVLKWAITRRQLVDDPVLPAPVLSTSRSQGFLPQRDDLTITWIGHSSFLIQCDGINVLTDPIWSDRASPFSFAGPRRVVPPGVRFAELPYIDATLISHDHYDHLDDRTVRRLIERFPLMQWLVPLHVGEFLSRRGATMVTELDWWEEKRFSSFSAACTPARHFSGRYPWNRNATLWCGWTINAGSRRIFFAGDTGFHSEFRRIAAHLGPFDLVILPIGAYEPRWFMQPVHMNPSDSVAAFHELLDPSRQCVMVASHWGTFRLTDEPLLEPPVLTRQFWSDASLPADMLWLLGPGETRSLPNR